MEHLIGNLRKFGLSEKEAKTYLACLELGDALASDISLKSDIPRTLVYDILERLIELGLVSYVRKDNLKYFRAADPQELIRVLKEKEQAVKDILPTLEQLQKAKGMKRPKVELFEGREGMKTVMNDILRSKVKEFLAYGSSRSSFEIIPAFMEDWHKERIQQKVMMRILYNDTKEAREKVKKRPESLKYAKFRFMPIKLESPTATIIYGSKVILQSWEKEPFAVMTESQIMADNQRKYFGELWKVAKQ
ncbi:MAG: helix-turn-helix domain-containing protein [Nanoarchaeota archaeon]